MSVFSALCELRYLTINGGFNYLNAFEGRCDNLLKLRLGLWVEAI